MDAFPFASDDSLDDEAFEALMGINDPGPDHQPLQDTSPASGTMGGAPVDPATMDTFPVAEEELDAIARDRTEHPSPEPRVSHGTTALDERIAYLQSHHCI